MIKKIISGGQTGADRAGLDFAIKHNIPHGGYCPKGRIAEDGTIPLKYNLIETTSEKYPPRTEKNIMESNGTLIFTFGRLERGSALTAKLCDKHHKPFLHVPGVSYDIKRDVKDIAEFIQTNKIEILNIAGNRESKSKGIHDYVLNRLEATMEYVSYLKFVNFAELIEVKS